MWLKSPLFPTSTLLLLVGVLSASGVSNHSGVPAVNGIPAAVDVTAVAAVPTVVPVVSSTVVSLSGVNLPLVPAVVFLL